MCLSRIYISYLSISDCHLQSYVSKKKKGNAYSPPRITSIISIINNISGTINNINKISKALNLKKKSEIESKFQQIRNSCKPLAVCDMLSVFNVKVI